MDSGLGCAIYEQGAKGMIEGNGLIVSSIKALGKGLEICGAQFEALINPPIGVHRLICRKTENCCVGLYSYRPESFTLANDPHVDRCRPTFDTESLAQKQPYLIEG